MRENIQRSRSLEVQKEQILLQVLDKMKLVCGLYDSKKVPIEGFIHLFSTSDFPAYFVTP